MGVSKERLLSSFEHVGHITEHELNKWLTDHGWGGAYRQHGNSATRATTYQDLEGLNIALVFYKGKNGTITDVYLNRAVPLYKLHGLTMQQIKRAAPIINRLWSEYGDDMFLNPDTLEIDHSITFTNLDVIEFAGDRYDMFIKGEELDAMNEFYEVYTALWEEERKEVADTMLGERLYGY